MWSSPRFFHAVLFTSPAFQSFCSPARHETCQLSGNESFLFWCKDVQSSTNRPSQWSENRWVLLGAHVQHLLDVQGHVANEADTRPGNSLDRQTGDSKGSQFLHPERGSKDVLFGPEEGRGQMCGSWVVMAYVALVDPPGRSSSLHAGLVERISMFSKIFRRASKWSSARRASSLPKAHGPNDRILVPEGVSRPPYSLTHYYTYLKTNTPCNSHEWKWKMAPWKTNILYNWGCSTSVVPGRVTPFVLWI